MRERLASLNSRVDHLLNAVYIVLIVASNVPWNGGRVSIFISEGRDFPIEFVVFVFISINTSSSCSTIGTVALRWSTTTGRGLDIAMINSNTVGQCAEEFPALCNARMQICRDFDGLDDACGLRLSLLAPSSALSSSTRLLLRGKRPVSPRGYV